MEIACLLNIRLNSECGSYRGKEELASLGECKDNISGHLASCHLSRESLLEFQLILARSGLNNVSADQFSHMKICPKHRNQIEKFTKGRHHIMSNELTSLTLIWQRISNGFSAEQYLLDHVSIYCNLRIYSLRKICSN